MNILPSLVALTLLLEFFSEKSLCLECGRRVEKTSARIQNGNEISQNDWPWLANLVKKSGDEEEDGTFICGATLISLKSVLTAAHCLQNKGSEKVSNLGDFEVQLGRHNLSDLDELKKNATVFEPIVIAIHPDWIYSTLNYDADLALLIAEENIGPLTFIKPICVIDHDILETKGRIVGWGFSNNENDSLENIAREALVKRVSPETCFLKNPLLATVSSFRTFCVQGDKIGASACQGDSGGGFYVVSGGTWSIHGIVSAMEGNGLCPTTNHTVYTKMSAFYKWIKEDTITQSFSLSFTQSDGKMKNDPCLDIKVQSVNIKYGSFLSKVGRSVDSQVKRLRLNNQDLGHLPNNIGYLFPQLEKLAANSLGVKFVERINFKKMLQLEVLDLSQNSIEEISYEAFYDLEKVKEIILKKNQLKSFHWKTFLNNPSLDKIDLSFNQIKPIELNNLRNINVQKLYLNNNQLNSIPDNSFHEMESLMSISINDNNLEVLNSSTFMKNPELTTIYASDNKIRILISDLFANNTFLRYFDIQNNMISKIEFEFKFFGTYNFLNNECIDKYYSAKEPSVLEELNQKIVDSCR